MGGCCCCSSKGIERSATPAYYYVSIIFSFSIAEMYNNTPIETKSKGKSRRWTDQNLDNGFLCVQANHGSFMIFDIESQ